MLLHQRINLCWEFNLWIKYAKIISCEKMYAIMQICLCWLVIMDMILGSMRCESIWLLYKYIIIDLLWIWFRFHEPLESCLFTSTERWWNLLFYFSEHHQKMKVWMRSRGSFKMQSKEVTYMYWLFVKWEG